MTAPALSAAEAALLARVTAAPDAPECLRERVAAALWHADTRCDLPWAELTADGGFRWQYLCLADAALAVVMEDARR